MNTIQDATTLILKLIGEDPSREGLIKTPQRVERAWQELTAGYKTDFDKLFNGAFFNAENNDMVIVKDISFYSLCEHHLLPFFGKAYVAYIPDKKIVGLSKIPRLVEAFSKRLQVQERLTHQIADTLHKALNPQGVGVIINAHHLCVNMRGIKNSSADTTTLFTTGVFKTNPNIMAEFIALCGINNPQ